MDVVVSTRADRDLVEIFAYVAQDSLKNAISVADRLNDGIASLASFPFRGAPRGDLGTDLRLLVINSHVLLYAVRRDYVIVLRVLHGSRNITRETLK